MVLDLIRLYRTESTKSHMEGDSCDIDPLIFYLGKKLKGFDWDGAKMYAVETRSSSPVRIIRDKSRQSLSLKGLYPAGEGAGYAGGIMSAAVDGIKTAEKITEDFYL